MLMYVRWSVKGAPLRVGELRGAHSRVDEMLMVVKKNNTTTVVTP